jgi:hypothetical protein
VWRATGHNFVISGDLKELLGDNPSEFGAITTEFQLVDVYRHRHGLDKPATFNCGHRRLDYILCSIPLLPSVSACGILPFNILSQSDHRTVLVDFDTKLLFGSLPSELASYKSPQFHSRDYENSELYVTSMHAYCNDNQVYQMTAEATESSDPTRLNHLDAEVSKAMEAGLQAVKKIYRTPFSPEMRQNRLIRSFYTLHLTQFKTGHSKVWAIRTVESKMTSPSLPPADQQECHLLLKDVQTKIRKLRQQAVQKRRDFLTRRVDFGGDVEKADKIRALIQKAEDLCEVCRKIRHVVRLHSSSGL